MNIDLKWLLVICIVNFQIGYSHHGSNHAVLYLKNNYEHVRLQLTKDHDLHYISEVFPGTNYHHVMIKEKSPINLPVSKRLTLLNFDPRVSWMEIQYYEPRELRLIDNTNTDTDPRFYIPPRENEPNFNDPLYPHQWYLHGYGKHHVNVVPVWQQGITGKGINVVILDDNVNPLNPEIAPNYDRNISADLGEHTGPGIKKNPVHGTYCAAVVAGAANNSFCGIGVAYNAKIGGIRLLAKRRVLDVQEAKALNYQLDRVHIYSASWGPPDDGKHLGGPKRFSSKALLRGVNQGRQGLGVIYVWASGNGGSKGDHCGYDGFASSIYTLTVSSLTYDGMSAFYAEPCPAVLTSVYVGGSHTKWGLLTFGNKVVVPEGNGDGCNDNFQGTSAAAPIAAGIIALLLEANPKLSWRDVHHLVVLNSFPSNDRDEWPVNGAGLRSNVYYGFGALNSARLVDAGRRWKSVPDQKTATTACPINGPVQLEPDRPVEFNLRINVSINSLEYVVVTLSVDVVPRGSLSVSLKSPSGFVSHLLSPRPRDYSKLGFRNWKLSSAQFWNESSQGSWRLSFTNNGYSKGFVRSCSLTVYGF